MSKVNPSPDIKQIRCLIGRFLKIYDWHIIGIVLLFLVLIIVPRFLSISAAALFVLGAFLFAGCPLILHWKYRERCFLHGLSDGDLALIESAANSDSAALIQYRQTAREILTARKNYQSKEENVLLRAAHLAHDDTTLLRPTATNAEADKHELLRTTRG